MILPSELSESLKNDGLLGPMLRKSTVFGMECELTVLAFKRPETTPICS